MLATFGRAHGANPEKSGFDLYIRAPLPPAADLAVHTDGETPFRRLGDSFPAGYIDVDRTHWKALTGEDD